ncbi:MAG TPA: bifunctional diguanylate cyclase/phosphodiesterase [Solirubrobacteraceae bacterium]|jgi:diguanylate cyclase (GGDEF)-like protein|nr:bifunctional diguanylate cyclase/phosphodiesterase [Solirubrobacteraceae bacterium]
MEPLRRPPRSQLRIGFAARMLIVLGVTLALAGAAGGWAMGTPLRRDLEQRGVEALRSDAVSLARVPTLISGDEEDILTEASEVMDVIDGRPGVERAELIDRGGNVAAAGRHGRTGSRVRDGEALRAIVSGGPIVVRLPDGDFKYAIRVTLGSRYYALVLREDGTAFERQLAALRIDLLIVLGIALGGAFVLFWLFGGRSLIAAHRDALRHATRDSLTHLGNHRAFHSELARAASMTSRHAAPVALLLLDLDDFKFVNDRHGHGRGDDLLRSVARHVEGQLRFEDRAFRVGGDEFAVILPHTEESQAEVVAQRLLAALRKDGINASAGVSALHGAAADVVVLREEADAALYEAKRLGRARHVAFSSIRTVTAVVTAEKRAALAQLLARPAIDVAFQPIWDLRTTRPLGVEALARPAAELGLGGPAAAFDVAQHTGDLFELDRLCVRSAIAAAGDLPDDVLLFLNVAPQSIDVGSEMIDVLLEALGTAGMRPEQVVIEVTERLGARASSVVRGVAALREHGFRLALDDVGAGNSGLQTLRELTLDFVKIDRAICAAALTDDAARAVLQAINAYAAETGAFVIAEGIENEGMLSTLRTLHAEPKATIQGGQGFGLGRPVATLAAALGAPAAVASS